MTSMEMILSGAIIGLIICVIVIGDQVQAIKAKRK
jgi:hypothetical protein